jgi:hypothetical protein
MPRDKNNQVNATRLHFAYITYIQSIYIHVMRACCFSDIRAYILRALLAYYIILLSILLYYIYIQVYIIQEYIESILHI